jgi:hypothetical protein
MPRISKTHKNRKLEDPASHLDKPSEVAKDGQLGKGIILLPRNPPTHRVPAIQ